MDLPDHSLCPRTNRLEILVALQYDKNRISHLYRVKHLLAEQLRFYLSISSFLFKEYIVQSFEKKRNKFTAFQKHRQCLAAIMVMWQNWCYDACANLASWFPGDWEWGKGKTPWENSLGYAPLVYCLYKTQDWIKDIAYWKGLDQGLCSYTNRAGRRVSSFVKNETDWANGDHDKSLENGKSTKLMVSCWNWSWGT